MLRILKKILLLSALLGCASSQAMTYQRAVAHLRVTMFPRADEADKPLDGNARVAAAIYQIIFNLKKKIKEQDEIPAPDLYSKALAQIKTAYQANPSINKKMNEAIDAITLYLASSVSPTAPVLPAVDHRRHQSHLRSLEDWDGTTEEEPRSPQSTVTKRHTLSHLDHTPRRSASSERKSPRDTSPALRPLGHVASSTMIGGAQHSRLSALSRFTDSSSTLPPEDVYPEPTGPRPTHMRRSGLRHLTHKATIGSPTPTPSPDGPQRLVHLDHKPKVQHRSSTKHVSWAQEPVDAEDTLAAAAIEIPIPEKRSLRLTLAPLTFPLSNPSSSDSSPNSTDLSASPTEHKSPSQLSPASRIRPRAAGPRRSTNLSPLGDEGRTTHRSRSGTPRRRDVWDQESMPALDTKLPSVPRKAQWTNPGSMTPTGTAVTAEPGPRRRVGWAPRPSTEPVAIPTKSHGLETGRALASDAVAPNPYEGSPAIAPIKRTKQVQKNLKLPYASPPKHLTARRYPGDVNETLEKLLSIGYTGENIGQTADTSWAHARDILDYYQGWVKPTNVVAKADGSPEAEIIDETSRPGIIRNRTTCYRQLKATIGRPGIHSDLRNYASILLQDINDRIYATGKPVD